MDEDCDDGSLLLEVPFWCWFVGGVLCVKKGYGLVGVLFAFVEVLVCEEDTKGCVCAVAALSSRRSMEWKWFMLNPMMTERSSQLLRRLAVYFLTSALLSVGGPAPRGR